MLKRLFGIEEETGPYYVYEIYIVVHGRDLVLYAGKGSGDRVYQHEKRLRTKLKKRGVKLDAKERLMLLAEDLGYTLYTRIVQSGLTEVAAYNLENQVITEKKLLQRGNVAYPHRIQKAPRLSSR